MTTTERPTLSLLEVADEFKTFSVTGKAGMEMPEHISTQEAVVVVQDGSAIIKMDDKEQELKTGNIFIIPGGKLHSLTITGDFKAAVIMAKESKIEFKQ